MWQWKKIFFIASALNVLAALFYFIVGSGVEQQWSKDTECDQIQGILVFFKDDINSIQ